MVEKIKYNMETKVVNLYKNPYDVYIGRAGKGQDGYFGNPIKLLPNEVSGATIERYKDYFYNRLENDQEFKNKILSLKGKVLGCFCKPKECHGDVIVDYLNSTSDFVERHLIQVKEKQLAAKKLYDEKK